ncbi:MAG: hypothetical protein LUG21_00460 [Clostridiales bacterium]|nr:hypothetical protein [Clostridiales bacterium]
MPFYDRKSNKYMYLFDSDIQKSSYTNVNTGEVLENEYCFFDRDGYLMYDKEHTFKGEKNEDRFEIYSYPHGAAYYWALSMSWDKDLFELFLNCFNKSFEHFLITGENLFQLNN